jgi:hypothetical protein
MSVLFYLCHQIYCKHEPLPCKHLFLAEHVFHDLWLSCFLHLSVSANIIESNKLGISLFKVGSEEEYFQGQGQGKYKSFGSEDIVLKN